MVQSRAGYDLEVRSRRGASAYNIDEVTWGNKFPHHELASEGDNAACRGCYVVEIHIDHFVDVVARWILYGPLNWQTIFCVRATDQQEVVEADYDPKIIALVLLGGTSGYCDVCVLETISGMVRSSSSIVACQDLEQLTHDQTGHKAEKAGDGCYRVGRREDYGDRGDYASGYDCRCDFDRIPLS